MTKVKQCSDTQGDPRQREQAWMSMQRQAANSLRWQMFWAWLHETENLIFNAHHFLFVMLGSGKGKRVRILYFTLKHGLLFHNCLCRIMLVEPTRASHWTRNQCECAWLKNNWSVAWSPGHSLKNSCQGKAPLLRDRNLQGNTEFHTSQNYFCRNKLFSLRHAKPQHIAQLWIKLFIELTCEHWPSESAN